jgi:hypothetical protein
MAMSTRIAITRGPGFSTERGSEPTAGEITMPAMIGNAVVALANRIDDIHNNRKTPQQ